MQINNLIDLGWTNYFQSQLNLESLDSELPFRVVSVQRNLLECVGLNEQNQHKNLQLSTYTWRHEPPEAHPTVGDWLMADYEFKPLYLLARKNLIKRRGASRESLIQLIASNIDTLFIVTSCNDEFNINRVERYLSLAAESDIPCVLILTKVDLCSDVTSFINILSHNNPNLAVETVNATEPQSLCVLEKWISYGQTIALLGSSGVGKSTIINSLKGVNHQTTAGVRESDSKGRHTTTSRSLHCLTGGGLLLDNPGMRELQIVDNEEGIKSTFSDIDILARDCYFTDCQHTTEPGCTVTKEIQAGQLEQRRLDNYNKLMLEQMRNNETLAERRHNDRALGRFYKHAKKSSRKFKSKE